MLSFLPPSPLEVMDNLKTNFRKQRKALAYTQEELATRSGVSLGTLKRFERTGQISLESLLKLAFVLECLEEFGTLCKEKEDIPKSLDELLKQK